MKKIVSLLMVFALVGECMISAQAEQEELRLPVVMYHDISTRSSTWNNYVIAPQELENDLKYLRDHGWESISVQNLLEWYEGRFRMPEKPFMITFDDGAESVLAYAEPLLKEYGFCGVVAVIGSVCQEFSENGEHDSELSNMSWEDAAAAAERGVLEVQCHTWDMHGIGKRVGCNKISWEDGESYRTKLTNDLNRFLCESETHDLDLTMTIAYPYGAYCADTTEAVRELGFRAAFTCTEQVNILTGNEDELYHLARFNRPHACSSREFFSKWE